LLATAAEHSPQLTRARSSAHIDRRVRDLPLKEKEKALADYIRWQAPRLCSACRMPCSGRRLPTRGEWAAPAKDGGRDHRAAGADSVSDAALRPKDSWITHRRLSSSTKPGAIRDPGVKLREKRTFQFVVPDVAGKTPGNEGRSRKWTVSTTKFGRPYGDDHSGRPDPPTHEGPSLVPLPVGRSRVWTASCPDAFQVVGQAGAVTSRERTSDAGGCRSPARTGWQRPGRPGCRVEILVVAAEVIGRVPPRSAVRGSVRRIPAAHGIHGFMTNVRVNRDALRSAGMVASQSAT